MKATHRNAQIQTYTFLGILIAIFILVLFIFKPLFNVLAFTLILTIVFNPLFTKLKKWFKSDSLAAALTVLIVLIVIAGFFWVFGQLLFNELTNLYSKFRGGEFVFNRDDLVAKLPISLQEPVRVITQDLNSIISRLTSGAFQTVSFVFSNLASFFFNVFLVFFALYYLLKDGEKIKNLVLKISPISNNQENILYEKVTRSVNGVMKGTFLVAVIQATVGCIGFLFFGLPNPILWTMAVFLAAFIPNIGTSLVIIPAVLYLYFDSSTPLAIGMAIWGALAVGLIDNLVSPKLVGRSAQLHPLLVLLSVIGGLQLFGFLGFLIGPIVLAIFSALIEMYIVHFKEYLE